MGGIIMNKYVIACRYNNGKLGFIFNLDPIIWVWECKNAKVYTDWDEVSNVFEENTSVFDKTISSTDISSIFIKPV